MKALIGMKSWWMPYSIFQEYIGQLKKIMYSRGYRSPFEKAVAMAKIVIKKAKARKKECIKKIMNNKEERFSKRFRKAYDIWRSPIRLWIRED